MNPAPSRDSLGPWLVESMRRGDVPATVDGILSLLSSHRAAAIEEAAVACIAVGARSGDDDSETGYAFRGCAAQCAAAVRSLDEVKT